MITTAFGSRSTAWPAFARPKVRATIESARMHQPRRFMMCSTVFLRARLLPFGALRGEVCDSRESDHLTESTLFLVLPEVPQIRRRLALAGRHQKAVAA